MPFHANPGDTLLLPKSREQTPHLWVILTRPDEKTQEVVIVNLTTKRNHSDTTLILNKGDHPFISRTTVVNFVDARFAKVDSLKNAVNSNRFRYSVFFDPKILKEIQQGLLVSPFTPGKVKDYCRLQFR